ELFLARLAATLRLPVPRFGDVVQAPPEQAGADVVNKRFVEACHRRNIAVHTWTVNDPDELEQLASIGVDAIITDDPTITPADWRQGIGS
ncbi:MAG: hypothetical protein HKN24_06720, partial [Acidimicrobiales bacterium]|nr:hypothetical protein [Acidimicrobiales bacterium]